MCFHARFNIYRYTKIDYIGKNQSKTTTKIFNEPYYVTPPCLGTGKLVVARDKKGAYSHGALSEGLAAKTNIYIYNFR